MTVTFGRNANNDMYLDPQGNLAVLNGLEAVASACEAVSLAQLGEEVLTSTLGIPNFQVVWTGNPNLAIWNSYLEAALYSVNGVTQVKDLQSFVQNNTLYYQVTLVTIYGTTNINGTL